MLSIIAYKILVVISVLARKIVIVINICATLGNYRTENIIRT